MSQSENARCNGNTEPYWQFKFLKKRPLKDASKDQLFWYGYKEENSCERFKNL